MPSLLLTTRPYYCLLKPQAFSFRLSACGFPFHFLPSSHERQSGRALFPQQVYSLPNLASSPISIPTTGALDVLISTVLKAYDNIQQKEDAQLLDIGKYESYTNRAMHITFNVHIL